MTNRNNAHMRTSIFLTLALIAIPQLTAAAAFPKDFKVVEDKPGVTLLSRGKDFVQVINPTEGGSIHLLTGKVMEWSETLALERKGVGDWWTLVQRDLERPFSVVNGQFFNQSEGDRAALAFSVKANGSIVSGYADRTEYVGKKRVLLINGAKSDVKPYADDPDSLLKEDALNAIVGLNPKAEKQASRRRGRTFVGVGKRGTLYVYSSPATTQNYVARMLRKFGVKEDKIVMLDGGGSAYLVKGGKQILTAIKGQEPPARALPQVLAITSGLSARTSAQAE